ncbi:hypothetical protein QL285_077146 [Trifolium repens]|nr:hypothetical protein QL285_077146 [Trifolium repens]
MQTSLDNDTNTTMRPVVAKQHQGNKTTPRIKQPTPTQKRSSQIHRDLQISTDLKTFNNSKKSSANLNKFEKWSENLESKKTNHGTSTATSSPPTTTTSPHH